jgi:hypothetical protein
MVVGAQAVCYINGTMYGQVSSFRWSSDTPYRPLYGLDCIWPQELVPTVVKVSAQLNIYRMVGDGGLEGAGITAPYASLPRQQYFTLSLRDRYSDNLLFESRWCVVDTQTWDVPAKGLVTGSFSVTGIAWHNEVSNSTY